MTGKEHFERAEELLSNIASIDVAERMKDMQIPTIGLLMSTTIAQAQVHATLALTMATRNVSWHGAG